MSFIDSRLGVTPWEVMTLWSPFFSDLCAGMGFCIRQLLKTGGSHQCLLREHSPLVVWVTGFASHTSNKFLREQTLLGCQTGPRNFSFLVNEDCGLL